MNLFEEAIKKEELLNFVIGQDEYFIPDRDYGEYWVLMAWKTSIIPYKVENGESLTNDSIVLMIDELIAAEGISMNKKIDFCLHHLYVYYYLKGEKFFESDAFEEKYQNIHRFLNDYFVNYKQDVDYKASRNSVSMIMEKGGLKSYLIVNE
jgi:hypothetical protein